MTVGMDIALDSHGLVGSTRAVRRHYDTVSEAYNSQLGNSAGRGPDGRFRRLMELVPAHVFQSDSPVLELGCGTGLYSRRLLSRFHGRYIGSDLSPGMLRVAERSGIHPLLSADVCRLPLADDSVAAVFGFGVLHHVPDTPRVFREVARVLQPGGSLFIMEPNRLNPLNVALALLKPIERGMLQSHRDRWCREAAAAGLRVTASRRGAFCPSYPVSFNRLYDVAEFVLERTPLVRETAIFDMIGFSKPVR